jgi:hypothetical protein
MFQMDTDLLTRSRRLLDEAKRLVATDKGLRTILKAKDSDLLTSSRARIAESKHLLAKLAIETPTPAIKPKRAVGPDSNSATLSVHVFQESFRFGWTLSAPSKDVLGRGTAETEQKARIDALQAGMTYIDRAKGRSSPDDDTYLASACLRRPLSTICADCVISNDCSMSLAKFAVCDCAPV